MGINWAAAGAGFFQGLNDQQKAHYDEQKTFNEQYEGRVQKGIDAYNASVLEAKTNSNKILGMASLMGDASDPVNVTAAKQALATDPERKWTIEELQRLKPIGGQPKGAVNNPVPPSPMLPGGAETPQLGSSQPMQQTQPSTAPQAPMAASGPAMATQASAPAMAAPAPSVLPPQASGPSPVTSPQLGGLAVSPPQVQLPAQPMAPQQGVADSGWRGKLAHFLTGAPRPGERESVAAARSGAMNNISPEQANVYAGFHKQSPGFSVEATGGLSQMPPLKEQMELAQKSNNAPAVVAALRRGDPTGALEYAYTSAQSDVSKVQAAADRAEVAAKYGVQAKALGFQVHAALSVLQNPLSTPDQVSEASRQLSSASAAAASMAGMLPTVAPVGNGAVPSVAGATPATPQAQPQAGKSMLPPRPPGVPPTAGYSPSQKLWYDPSTKKSYPAQ